MSAAQHDIMQWLLPAENLGSCADLQSCIMQWLCAMSHWPMSYVRGDGLLPGPSDGSLHTNAVVLLHHVQLR